MIHCCCPAFIQNHSVSPKRLSARSLRNLQATRTQRQFRDAAVLIQSRSRCLLQRRQVGLLKAAKEAMIKATAERQRAMELAEFSEKMMRQYTEEVQEHSNILNRHARTEEVDSPPSSKKKKGARKPSKKKKSAPLRRTVSADAVGASTKRGSARALQKSISVDAVRDVSQAVGTNMPMMDAFRARSPVLPSMSPRLLRSGATGAGSRVGEDRSSPTLWDDPIMELDPQAPRYSARQRAILRQSASAQQQQHAGSGSGSGSGRGNSTVWGSTERVNTKVQRWRNRTHEQRRPCPPPGVASQSPRAAAQQHAFASSENVTARPRCRRTSTRGE